MRHLLACLIIVIVACNGLTNPPTGPGTEYPCGVWGVTCSVSSANAMCCAEGEICGYDGAFSRCPAGSCCYEGGEWLTASPDGGFSRSENFQKRVNR